MGAFRVCDVFRGAKMQLSREAILSAIPVLVLGIPFVPVRSLVLLAHKSKWTASAAEGFAQAALYAGEV